jgi:hypothetical protein
MKRGDLYWEIGESMRMSPARISRLEAEAEKLDGWADDMKLGREREIKHLYREIEEARRAMTAAERLRAS